MIRSAGVLMAVSSLPSPYGIGTMGKEAREFIDFLADAGQTYWQILPLGPTGYGNSPYQSLSSFAGNPYLIDLDELAEDGLLKPEEIKAVKWQKKADHADYGILYENRFDILRKAADRLPLVHPQEYLAFIRKEAEWLKDYAVFMAIKTERKGETWLKWPKELRIHNSQEVRDEAERLKEDVVFWMRIQYFFYTQAAAMKKYANDRGIQIIGDLPFYAASDSIDAWSHPEQFEIDSNYEMTFVSGMAPDGGSPKGQKWGNPLFAWDRMRNEDYRWWISRAVHQTRFCDVLRIDHFQGYESYFAVPAKDEDASNGHWRKGPGLDIFRRLEQNIPGKQMIVEDLGVLTHEFLNMVRESGYPGMRILEYAFDPNDPGSIYMPFQYEKNTVVYTGTHDNDTLEGWRSDPVNSKRIERAAKYFGIDEKDIAEGMIRAAYASTSDLAVIQMQDILGLGSEARMNDPSGSIQPWTWRMKKTDLKKGTAEKLKEMMLLYCRNNWNIKDPKQ